MLYTDLSSLAASQNGYMVQLTSCVRHVQLTQQLQEQQQTAADQAASLEAEVSQLQQQLQITQTEAEETHAAAKLRQIEHEGRAQALAQALPLLLMCF